MLVPLASAAGDEQVHNARFLVGSGAAVALFGAVSPEDLRAAVGPLLAEASARGEIAENARKLGRPDAAGLLAAVLLEVAV